MASLDILRKAYVSAVDPMLDTREIDPKVIDIANEMELTDIMNLAGLKKETVQPIYYSWVNEALYKFAVVTSVTGSGTPTVTIVLTLASSGFVRKNDMLLFTNKVTGQVQSVTTASSVDTIVVKSATGGNITVTAADKLAIYALTMGERAISGSNVVFGLTKYSNKVQIFGETSIITNIQSASTVTTEFNGEPKIILKDHLDKKIKLKGSINAQYIIGDMSATNFSDANPTLVDQYSLASGGGAVQTTRGIDKYVNAYGVETVVGALGTVTFTDMDAHTDALLAIRAPKKLIVGSGTAVMRTFSKFWNNLSASSISSVRMVTNGTEIKNFDVTQVKYGGFDFQYMLLPIMDNPVLLAQTDVVKRAYYIPADKKVKIYGDGGGNEPAIRIRYMKNGLPNNNDIIGEKHTGALSPFGGQNDISEWKCTYETIQGLEVLGAQFFSSQKVNA